MSSPNTPDQDFDYDQPISDFLTMDDNNDGDTDLSENDSDATIVSGSETSSININIEFEPTQSVQNEISEGKTEDLSEEKTEDLSEEKTENNIEESKESSDEHTKQCSVCYIDLNIDNVVNTTCNHSYCRKCFFRWMKSSSSCPMCRRNLVSRSVWYQNNDMNEELEELATLNETIQGQLIRAKHKYHKYVRKNKELSSTNNKLRKANNEEIMRTIRLNNDINYSRGYIKGLEGQASKSLMEKLKDKNYSDSYFIRGYYAGYYNRKEITSNKKIMTEFKSSFVKNEPSSGDETNDEDETSSGGESKNLEKETTSLSSTEECSELNVVM